jgi:hypothetical protein
MNFSELAVIFSNYDKALWSPTRMNIKLGCDCGCCGNSYTKESWDAEEAQAQKDIDIMREWCYNNGIEWDGEE